MAFHVKKEEEAADFSPPEITDQSCFAGKLPCFPLLDILQQQHNEVI